jgi:hypothetical protein
MGGGVRAIKMSVARSTIGMIAPKIFLKNRFIFFLREEFVPVSVFIDYTIFIGNGKAVYLNSLAQVLKIEYTFSCSPGWRNW